MNSGLRDVISIAAEGGSRRAGGQALSQAPGQASGNVTAQGPAQAIGKGAALQTPAGQAAAGTVQPAAPTPSAPASDIPALGRAGLRMAFWLCGFREALLERQRTGEHLTEREQSLLTLSRADFADIRPAVISAALSRLHAVVHDPALLGAGGTVAVASAEGPSHAELFALETVRNLAGRARQTFETDGPDAALSLFGGNASLQEPLAIFQAVFSAALGLVESFERLAHPGQALLARLADGLDAEVGRI